jgi:Ca-activated chloride channel family protein
MMVFLTDGTPTAGEQAPEKILDQFVKENESRTKVFVVGVGNDVNAHLLDRLAESSEGSSEYVGPDEDIDVKVAALYDRLANPFLNEVQLDFGELKTAAVFPKKLTALFQGSDIMLAGRYKNGGKHKITLAGTLNGEKRTYRYELDIPAKPGAASATDFVAPLWASRNIGFYLQEIRLHGQTDELVKEVIRLSKQFGIVTEYTAFLAQGGGHGISDEKAFAMARDSMKMANAEQSGKWAMAQVENERKLQAADAAAPAAARSFKDSRGEVQSVAKVRTLGRRALYQQASGQWLDSEAAGDRTNRTVKAFSPEYFDLMQRSDDFRQAAELGDNLSINIGQERITVEK